jgi:hypothetical protein
LLQRPGHFFSASELRVEDYAHGSDERSDLVQILPTGVNPGWGHLKIGPPDPAALSIYWAVYLNQQALGAGGGVLCPRVLLERAGLATLCGLP